MKNTIFIGLLLIALVGLTACGEVPITPPTDNQQLDLTGSQELKQFKTVDELKTFLALQPTSNNAYRGEMMLESVSFNKATTASDAVAPMPSGGAGVDYSQTNVQIANVDESDFVKNDDKYIYMIADNKLIIIDAKDGTNAEIVSETEIPGKDRGYYYGIKELFLNGDKVILFTDDYEETFYLSKYDITPIPTQKQNTKAIVYDVSNRKDPEISETFSISGSYYDSRMIGDIVYIVSQEGLYDWQYYDGPVVSYAKTFIRPEIYYFDNPEQNHQMNTVTSINIDTEEVVDAKSLMLGYSNTLMVSENNIFIAYQKQNYWCWGWRCAAQEDNNRERFVTVVVPLLKGEIKNQVKDILNQDLEPDEEWTKISAALSALYSEIQDSDELQATYEEMFSDIEDALNEYDSKKALEQSKTIIHRLSISDGKINYESKGEVEGTLLNQFSLDEYEENLRVATTTSIWLNKGGRKQHNNVFVLNPSMDTIGSLKNIAENESIYSTRFMGEKMYMVTFRQIDPFFVIDLSVPEKPEILGYLKIPGYSSYLHPISDNLIIGVGKDTKENEFGGVITQGVKISLFDVSDFSNPKELDKYEIGLEGTDSPILHDHKAFLYSPTKKILVIPVTEVTDRVKSGEYYYRTKLWNGAYVFNVNDEGFELFGKVRHSSSETQYYSWFNSASVMRSLYIGDNLYTISNQYVKANDLSNDLESLSSITLPGDKEKDIEPPIMIE